MLRQRSKKTHEDAARFGAKANLGLGFAQLGVAVATGNVGFFTEFIHQTADAASLQAKAEAMQGNRSPRSARRLRKFGASILLGGGFVGIIGAANHILQNTTEDHSGSAIVAATVGAAINAVVALKSHGAEHGSHEGHTHQHGAAKDTVVHIFTDMGTSILYAGALATERHAPGITNAVLIGNGIAIGGAGAHTVHRIHQDEQAHTSDSGT